MSLADTVGDAPLVSICIPTYCQAQFLGEAVESALAQDYPNFEVVVSDDCSPDETQDVLRAFKDNRLRAIRQKRNLGISANSNACIGASRGKYIVRFDSDDILAPNYVSQQAAILRANPSVSFAHCACELINEAGKHVGYSRSIQGSFIRPGRQEFLRYLYGSRATNVPIFRRSHFKQVGGYNEDLTRAVDWELYLKLLLVGDVAYNDDVLFSHRTYDLDRAAYQPIGWARSVLRILDDVLPSMWPGEIGNGDTLLCLARRFHARRMALISVWMSREIREEVIRTAHELDPGLGTRMAALAVRTVPSLVRGYYRWERCLRQTVKSLLYRR